MLKVVFDANVFVGASIRTHGVAAAVLNGVFDNKYSLMTSPAILEEIRRVLKYPGVMAKSGWSLSKIDRFVNLIETVSENMAGSLKLSVVKDDPTDDKYIIAALESEADYIVSRDRHLLNLGKYQEIKIITPEEMLKIMTELR